MQTYSFNSLQVYCFHSLFENTKQTVIRKRLLITTENTFQSFQHKALLLMKERDRDRKGVKKMKSKAANKLSLFCHFIAFIITSTARTLFNHNKAIT